MRSQTSSLCGTTVVGVAVRAAGITLGVEVGAGVMFGTEQDTTIMLTISTTGKILGNNLFIASPRYSVL
jgi:hypothetical protein